MTPFPLLAQVTELSPMGSPPAAWIPVVLLLLIGIGFAVGNIAISLLIGPSRTGAVKGGTYESGMVPIGDTRRRFNVRFYVVAMLFLVVDVEIVFFYPWATIFSPAVEAGDQELSNLLLLRIVVFTALLLVGYLYAWGKGAFRWD